MILEGCYRKRVYHAEPFKINVFVCYFEVLSYFLAA